MLTQCPNCQTSFRVTSEILRVADGQVRCGRCHTQFDALARLIDEGRGEDVQSGRFLQPSRNQPQRSPASEIEVEEQEEQEDITLEGRHIEITGTYRALDDLDSDGEPRVHQEVTEEWVEIDDLDSELASEESGEDGIVVEEEEIASEDFVEDAEEFEEEEEQSREEVFAAAPPPRRVSPIVAMRRRPVYEEAIEEIDLPASRAPSARSTLLWKLLAVPLVLVLVAQVIHHNRASLARNPMTGNTLMSVYGALHLPLTPDWNLHAYYIKQWGVLSDPAAPGTLRVRASITNRASFAQPYPLLKLVLEDRWGDQVRAREFEPVEYLDPGSATDRMLAPEQQVNATVAIVDPGPDAEGFRFDVCLKGKAGAVCAADVPE